MLIALLVPLIVSLGRGRLGLDTARPNCPTDILFPCVRFVVSFYCRGSVDNEATNDEEKEDY